MSSKAKATRVTKTTPIKAAKAPPAPAEKTSGTRKERKLVYSMNNSDFPLKRLKDIKFVLVSSSIEKSKRLNEQGQATEYLNLEIHGYLPEEDPALARKIYFELPVLSGNGYNSEYDSISHRINMKVKQFTQVEGADEEIPEYEDPVSSKVYDQLDSFRSNLVLFLSENVEILKKIMSKPLETPVVKGKERPLTKKAIIRIIDKGLTQFPRKKKNPLPDDPYYYFSVGAIFMSLVGVTIDGGQAKKIDKTRLEDCVVHLSTRCYLGDLRAIANGAIGVGFTGASGVVHKVEPKTETIFQGDQVKMLQEKANSGEGFDVFGALDEVDRMRKAQAESTGDGNLDDVFTGDGQGDESEGDEGDKSSED
jgi:hypothetical protein